MEDPVFRAVSVSMGAKPIGRQSGRAGRNWGIFDFILMRCKVVESQSEKRKEAKWLAVSEVSSVGEPSIVNRVAGT